MQGALCQYWNWGQWQYNYIFTRKHQPLIPMRFTDAALCRIAALTDLRLVTISLVLLCKSYLVVYYQIYSKQVLMLSCFLVLSYCNLHFQPLLQSDISYLMYRPWQISLWGWTWKIFNQKPKEITGKFRINWYLRSFDNCTWDWVAEDVMGHSTHVTILFQN
jgi:hypothetical protein